MELDRKDTVLTVHCLSKYKIGCKCAGLGCKRAELSFGKLQTQRMHMQILVPGNAWEDIALFVSRKKMTPNTKEPFLDLVHCLPLIRSKFL